jgi:Protein of unknown function (DUF3800)
MSPRAFGGGEFVGANLVKLVYLDEAGVGRLEDPNVVVLGVMADADSQWLRVARHLVSLADKHAKPQHRNGFIFHVKELRWGSKRIPRDSYTKEEQDAMIADLCKIPKEFGLPLVCAYVERASFPVSGTRRDVVRGAQVIASAACACIVEKYLRETGNPDEGAQLYFEDNDDARSIVRDAHRHLANPDSVTNARRMGFELDHLLPLGRVPETASFTGKTDASLLQIADACVYAVTRHLAGKDSEGFFALVQDNFALRRPIKVGALCDTSEARPQPHA